MTYAEFLAAQGATPDEIKILVTPASEKAYAAMAKQAEDAGLRATKAESDKAAYDKWYKEVAEPTAAKALAERDQSALEAAAANAKIKKAQELGLLKIMEQIEGGAGVEPPVNPVIVSPPDMSKYVDRDTLLKVADQEGHAIAMAQDIAFEHARLFPDKPLSFVELRRKAVENRRSVQDQWLQDFNVQAARDAKAKADTESYEKRLREEGANAERAKLQTVNPHLVSPSVSTSPFTGRPPSAEDANKPWNLSDTERENRRLQKGLAGIAKLQ